MANGVVHLIWNCWVTCTLHVCVMSRMRLYVYLPSLLVIKFVLLSEFIRYRAIKVPPSNYFNTMYINRCLVWFLWVEWSAILAIWAELSSEIGTTGWVVLGQLFYGLSCPGPSCPEPVEGTHYKGLIRHIYRRLIHHVLNKDGNNKL